MILPTTIGGIVEAVVASGPGGCGLCGERHNPRFIRCEDVQARIDGVSVGNPEGTGGVACWVGPKPSRSLPPLEDEWRMGG